MPAISTKTLNDHLPYGIIVLDHDFGLVYANETVLKIFDDDKLAIELGKKFTFLKNYPELFLKVEDAFENKKGFSREFYLSEENIIQVDANFLPDVILESDKSSVTSKQDNIVLSLYPISHFKKSEKNQRQFVANVSHELKTPLTSVLGYLETLIDDPEIEAETRDKFLSIILRQAKRLSTIVTDLLTLSLLDKEELNQDSHDYHPHNIVDVMKNSVSSLKLKAEKKGIKIQLNGVSTLKLNIDSSLMEQAFVNLIDNAIKFTPVGGIVLIDVSKVGDVAEVRISDEGGGIPEKYHTRVFERFFSVDKGRSRKLGGSGLGLSIVKHIILNHNGEVFIKNKVNGNGSIFTIRLPI